MIIIIIWKRGREKSFIIFLFLFLIVPHSSFFFFSNFLLHTRQYAYKSRFSIAAHASGLDVAFLPGVFFEHTGEKLSAYKLNGFSRAWDLALNTTKSRDNDSRIFDGIGGDAYTIAGEEEEEEEFKSLKWDQNKLYWWQENTTFI